MNNLSRPLELMPCCRAKIGTKKWIKLFFNHLTHFNCRSAGIRTLGPPDEESGCSNIQPINKKELNFLNV